MKADPSLTPTGATACGPGNRDVHCGPEMSKPTDVCGYGETEGGFGGGGANWLAVPDPGGAGSVRSVWDRPFGMVTVLGRSKLATPNGKVPVLTGARVASALWPVRRAALPSAGCGAAHAREMRASTTVDTDTAMLVAKRRSRGRPPRGREPGPGAGIGRGSMVLQARRNDAPK